MAEIIQYNEYGSIMHRIAYWLLKNNKTYKTRDVYGADNIVMTRNQLEQGILDKGEDYGSLPIVSEYVECAINDNTDLSFLPNYATMNGVKYYKNEYVDMANRVSAYEVLHSGEHPKTVKRTSQPTSGTYDYFCQVFGTPNSIDDALKRVQGRGYGYYYNSRYNNKTAINRMKNKQGVNCTDSSQVFYRIGQALGYQTQFIHVKCSGGDGHVRLRFNKGNGWFYRDPAAVLKGNSITSNWCSNGRVIAYDPNWLYSDLDA